MKNIKLFLFAVGILFFTQALQSQTSLGSTVLRNLDSSTCFECQLKESQKANLPLSKIEMDPLEEIAKLDFKDSNSISHSSDVAQVSHHSKNKNFPKLKNEFKNAFPQYPVHINPSFKVNAAKNLPKYDLPDFTLQWNTIPPELMSQPHLNSWRDINS